MFDQMKELWKLRNQMMELQKQLGAVSVEAASKDGSVKVIMSGTQEVKEVSVTGDMASMKADKLADSIKDTVNRAIKMSQQEAAKKMQSSGLQLPGM